MISLTISKMRHKDGFLIAIEGIDQSGKETQSRLLARRIRREGYSADVINFPDYTSKIGLQLKDYLKAKLRLDPHAVHLLYAANKWESLNRINRKIRNGEILILNRYRGSNLAYGIAHGLPFEWLVALEQGLPEPELVLVLDISPKLSFERKKQDRDVHEKRRTYLLAVRRVYLKLAKRWRWTVIDGDRDRELVHSAIWEKVSPLLRKRSGP